MDRKWFLIIFNLEINFSPEVVVIGFQILMVTKIFGNKANKLFVTMYSKTSLAVHLCFDSNTALEHWCLILLYSLFAYILAAMISSL